MYYLVFVRHSAPVIDHRIPVSQWKLSQQGAERLDILAPMLEQYAPHIILSSPEVKSMETARRIGDEYGLEIEIEPNLREHQLSKEDFRSNSEFHETVHKFFTKKNELVFGLETSIQSYKRFESVVAKSCIEYQGSNLILGGY
jgi:broad specificity phosphatase PhoE